MEHRASGVEMKDWDAPDDPESEQRARLEGWAIGFLMAAAALIAVLGQVR